MISNQIIHIDPEIMGGTPVFHGTRVPVKNLFDYIGAGETIDFFLEDFPSVRKEQVLGLLTASLKLMDNSLKAAHENLA